MTPLEGVGGAREMEPLPGPPPGFLGVTDPWSTRHHCELCLCHRAPLPSCLCEENFLSSAPGSKHAAGNNWKIRVGLALFPQPWPFPPTWTQETTKRLPRRRAPQSANGSAPARVSHALQAFLAPGHPDRWPQPVLQGRWEIDPCPRSHSW